MRKMRLLLLPLGAAAELLVLAIAWGLALTGATGKSIALHDWATSTMPTVYWYIGE